MTSMNDDPFHRLADLALSPTGRTAGPLLDFVAAGRELRETADDLARPVEERYIADQRYHGFLAAEDDMCAMFREIRRAREDGDERDRSVGEWNLKEIRWMIGDEREPLSRRVAYAHRLAGYEAGDELLEAVVRARAGAL